MSAVYSLLAPKQLPTDFFNALIKPFDLFLLEQVNRVTEFTVGHFCRKNVSLERFADYPVHPVNWAHQSGHLSLSEGRDLFEGKSILGGLDERGPLVYGLREALRQEIVATMSVTGTRAFMLGAGCTVPSDIDIANLAYARDVAGRVNRYAASFAVL